MKKLRKFMALLIATIMMASNIAPAFAIDGGGGLPKPVSDDDKCPIVAGSNIPVKPVKPGDKETAESLTENPNQPDIYTLRTDYKVERMDADGKSSYEINYQPYIGSVGAAASKDEKDKVNKTIDLPDFTGYEKPRDAHEITYDLIKEKALEGERETNDFGTHYKANQSFDYDADTTKIRVKHVFQDIDNFEKYGPKPGESEYTITTEEDVKVGSTIKIKPLGDDKIKGFVPEQDFIKIQVPNDTNDFVVEYRYYRDKFNINFDTDGGTELPSRTLYYGQTIPKLDFGVTKVGAELKGWKANKDITYGKNGKKTLSKETLITENDFKQGIPYAMPAEDLTFTADWKEKDKAPYVIQFWTEKPDYNDKDDTLPLRDRYDFIGARRVDKADTGSRPGLTNLDIHGITFPDLNDGRLEKAQNDKKEFERYYFLNKELTQKQNASKKDPTVQKTVSSTGETVYNVYYDRRVYTLYFTAYNLDDPDFSYWPIITRDGQVLGKEGDPYKVNVRFNQSLDKIWPKDAEVSGLPKVDGSDPTGDDGLIGWYINHNHIDHPLIFRDTPPYRLSAEDFIDAEDVMGTDYDHGNGHADEIPIADGKTKKRDKYEIPLGASYIDTAIAYHIDIIKDDFEGKEQIDYDMSYWKSDTNTYDYEFILPHLQGFTLKKETRPAQLIGKIKVGDVEKTFDELNAERNKKTPFRSDDDKIEYISHFPWSQKLFDGTNAYDYANYYRNKYKLKLNNDPKTVKNDSEYGAENILDVPYEYPLKDLELDTKHKPVDRPTWVPEDWEFKGWALDPAGKNLIKNGKETKLHYDQVVYAKWGEPDKKYKVTFDPDGGSLESLSKDTLTTSKKTITEGDAGEEIEVTYPIREKSVGDKQVFTVLNGQILNEPINNKPTKKGYDFMGWEVIYYLKNEDGEYTEKQDTSYHDQYGVPELYTFGNEVVSPIYLKAIWVPNDRVDVKIEHYFLDENFNFVKKDDDEALEEMRAGQIASATATKQNEEYLLASHDELIKKLTGELKDQYEEYNERMKSNNSFYQNLRVEPEKIQDPNDTNNMIDNPKFDNNVFKFFYIPIRTREYKVNYIDESYKGSADETEGAIIPQETVVNGNRDFDARNYKKIPGWVLAEGEKPQKQLFFDVNKETNELIGINGTNSDEITFYYKDVRLIRVPDGDDSTPPKDYVRVTFKAGDNGQLQENGVPKEVSYYVVKGLPFSNIPVPKVNNQDGVNIVPDEGFDFEGWQTELLKDSDCVNQDYTFIAKFEKPKGKLTIKKVFENEPVDEESPKIMKAPKKEEPIEFEFKITGPNSFEKTFKLKAGDEKTFEDLAYGEYKVEEIDSKGYTAYYVEGDYNKESPKLSKDPISINLDKSNKEEDYQKTVTVVNKNIKPEQPGETNDNIIDIEVKKVWDGGTKPATTIELWRKGYEVKDTESGTIDKKVGDFTTTAGEDDDKGHTFKNLPKHDPSGREFTYYVKEPNISKGYKSSITGSMTEGFTVTNTYQKIDVVANKVWEDDIKEGETRQTIYFKLYRKIKDGEELEVQGQELKELPSGTTKVTWKDLDRFDEKGNEYIYSVKEVNEDGEDFVPEGYKKSEDGLTVTNTKDTVVPPTPETKTITVKATKIWQGGPDADHGQVNVMLTRKSANPNSVEEVVIDSFTIDPNVLTNIGENLPIKDKENYLYTYKIVELGVYDNNNYYVGDNKYLSTVEKDDANSTDDTWVFKVENAYQNPQEPENIIAYKKWVNVPNTITKPSVFFQLQRNIDGEVPYDVEEQRIEVGNVVNQYGFIEVNFGNQEESDKDGNPYTYSVKEVDVNGNPFVSSDYETTEDGLYVVNKYKTKDPVPVPDPEPTPDPTPDPKPEPDPIIPGEDDTPSTPDKPDEPETPDKPENPKPEKPEDKIPEKPEKEKPPVKTENNKTSQSGTKFVKKINQTGTKIIANVKNFLNPTTGIITNYEIYIGLMAASSVGLFLTREKKNKDEE